MDCRVVVEAAVPVYDVETADEAVRIAISKTGKMLNPDLSYVEIDVGTRRSPSGEALEPAFIVADEALVALELEMTVFNVERTEHAARIARKEIGQRMHDVPLDVLDVSVLDEEGGGSPDGEGEDSEDGGNDEPGVADENGGNDRANANADGSTNLTASEERGERGGNGDESAGTGTLDPGGSDTGSADTDSEELDESEGTDAGGNEDDTDTSPGPDEEGSEREDVLPEFEELLDE